MPKVAGVGRREKSKAIARAVYGPANGDGFRKMPDGLWHKAPNYFAASPEGAQAREEALAFLCNIGWEFRTNYWQEAKRAFVFAIHLEYGVNELIASSDGESTSAFPIACAEALYAAVVAMGGEND